MISSYFYCPYIKTTNTLNYTKTHTWRMQHRDKHKQAHTHTRTHKRAAVYVCVWQRQRQSRRDGRQGGIGGGTCRCSCMSNLPTKLQHGAATHVATMTCRDRKWPGVSIRSNQTMKGAATQIGRRYRLGAYI